jgi:hypothetical protein
MTTITDILYQKYVSNQNEPVCMSKDYFNKPSYFNISFVNFQKSPNKMMYILSTSFIHKLLNTKTTYQKEKFIYLKSILDNPFISSNEKTNFLSIFQDIQHINNSLCKFVWKCKWNKSKLANQHDLIMNPINENQYFVCSLLQYGRKYLFTKSDLTKIIENALINSPYIHAEPLPIKNPYNNSIFDKSHLYNIYFFMKHGGFILPSIFHEYFLHNFHLKIFRNNTEHMIRKMHIKTMTDNHNSNKELIRDIKTMLEMYNDNCNKDDMRIRIHKNFPEDTLICAMKPYLHLYYSSNYSLCTSTKTNAQIELLYQLNLFKQKSPGFGRKITKIINSDNLFNKKTKKIDVYNTEFSRYITNSYYKNYETSHIEIIEDSTDAEKDMYNYILYSYFPRNNIINSVVFYDTDEDINENNNVENNDRMVINLDNDNYDDYNDDDLFDDTFDD